jgi:hypothetical protein
MLKCKLVLGIQLRQNGRLVKINGEGHNGRVLTIGYNRIGLRPPVKIRAQGSGRFSRGFGCFRAEGLPGGTGQRAGRPRVSVPGRTGA